MGAWNSSSLVASDSPMKSIFKSMKNKKSKQDMASKGMFKKKIKSSASPTNKLKSSSIAPQADEYDDMLTKSPNSPKNKKKLFSSKKFS